MYQTFTLIKFYNFIVLTTKFDACLSRDYVSVTNAYIEKFFNEVLESFTRIISSRYETRPLIIHISLIILLSINGNFIGH